MSLMHYGYKFNLLAPEDVIASQKLVNIGPGNGWLPAGIHPLPEPILTTFDWVLRVILLQMLTTIITKICLTITD